MADQADPNWEEQEARLIAAGILRPAQGTMDWEAFWKLPRAEVSEEAVREAIAWAKGSAAESMIDRIISEKRETRNNSDDSSRQQ